MPKRTSSRSTSRRVATNNNEDLNLPSGMAEVSIQVLMLGLDLGWDLTVMRNGSLRLSREHDRTEVQILLPSNQRNIKQGVAQSWIRKVMRYADPAKRDFLMAAYEAASSTDSSERVAGNAMLQGLRSTAVMKDPRMLGRLINTEDGRTMEDVAVEEDARAERELEQVAMEAAKALDQVTTEMVADLEAEEKIVAEAHGEAVIVKVRPWVARHTMRADGGEVYHSKAVLERKWSDGSIDYQCSRCDWTNAEARNVAAHYGGKHGKDFPAPQQREEMYVDPAVTWVPTERQQGRIHRLARELQEAVTEVAKTKPENEITAADLAEYIVRKRDENRDEREDIAPLTEEQIIERVRRLVDRGAYADLEARIEYVQTECEARLAQAEVERQHERNGAVNAVRTLEARLEESESRISAAEQDAEQARISAKEATEKWQALKDIVNG